MKKRKAQPKDKEPKNIFSLCRLDSLWSWGRGWQTWQDMLTNPSMTFTAWQHKQTNTAAFYFLRKVSQKSWAGTVERGVLCHLQKLFWCHSNANASIGSWQKWWQLWARHVLVLQPEDVASRTWLITAVSVPCSFHGSTSMRKSLNGFHEEHWH